METNKIDWKGKLEIETPDGVFDVLGGAPPLIDGERMVFWKKKAGYRTYQNVDAATGRHEGHCVYQVRNKEPALPEGVTLWYSRENNGSNKVDGAGIKVDGEWSGYIYGDSRIDGPLKYMGYPYPRQHLAHFDMAELAKHRDEVRAKRAASKPDAEGHIPTPHEPVKGVKCWSYESNADIDGGPIIQVDGEWERYDPGSSVRTPTRNPEIVKGAESYRKRRDQVRAKRLADQKFIRLPDGNNIVVGDMANLRSDDFIAVVREFRSDGLVNVEWFSKYDGMSIGRSVQAYEKDGTYQTYPSGDDLVSKCVASDIPTGFPLDKIGDAVLRKQVEEARKPKIDPYRPIEGVELWARTEIDPNGDKAEYGAYVYVDGECNAYVSGDPYCMMPTDVKPVRSVKKSVFPKHWTIDFLVGFRDQARASRPDAEGHVSTPFEPVKGVTLYRHKEPIERDGRVTAVFVDGVQETMFDHTSPYPCLYGGKNPDAAAFSVRNGIKPSAETIKALREFRDHVRAERPESVEISTGKIVVGDIAKCHGDLYRICSGKVRFDGRQNAKIWSYNRWVGAYCVGTPYSFKHASAADIPEEMPLSDLPERLKADVEKFRQPRELSSDTFPTGNVYVRHDSWAKGARALVTDVGDHGIKYADGSNGVLYYRSLRVGYELSIDGGVTWRPATANAWRPIAKAA